MQDRIELVIVALRASECQSQKAEPDSVCDVLQNLLPPLHQIARIPFIRIVTVKAVAIRACGSLGHISSPAICS